MADTINVLVSEAGRGFGDEMLVRPLAIDKLRGGFAEIVAGLGQVIASATAAGSGLSLRQVEASLEISADGRVSLIGTTKASGSAAIRLIFRRA